MANIWEFGSVADSQQVYANGREMMRLFYLVLFSTLLAGCGDNNPVVYRTNTVTDTVKVCPPKDTCKHDCDDDWQARMIAKYSLPYSTVLARLHSNHPDPGTAALNGDVDGNGFVEAFDAGWLLNWLQNSRGVIVLENSNINCIGVVDWDDFWAFIDYLEAIPGDICPTTVPIPCPAVL